MNAWILLMISIGFEIVATALLKMSDGFTQFLPAIASMVLYGVSFYLVSIVYRTLPVGIVYAVWSGVGIVFTTVVAYFAFNQKIDWAGLLGIAFILSGVMIIHVFSKTS